MRLRTLACAALLLGPLLTVDAAAARACDGTECASPTRERPTKPLDILKFMREQAASTRIAKPGLANAHTAARTQRHIHRTMVARPQPATTSMPTLPEEAAASFASQEDPSVQVVASNEFNAIDAASAAAPAAPVETVGAAGPSVPLAVAEEFNDIDRKAAENAAARVEQAHVEQANSSWLHWLWSALGSTFTALATAVHHLIG
jgi:hypothetical protein